MAGGVTMIALILCSIVSITVIIERCIYYSRRSRVKRTEFMEDVRKELDRGNTGYALKICGSIDTPFSKVVHAGLSFAGHPEQAISSNMERTIIIETNLLERYTTIVGTIGSTAVYIGLFGTVLGIIRAFISIAQSAGGGINVVSRGISESLVCTAAGLIVAVPAVMAYNYFIKKIDNFITEMELCASETIDLLTGRKNEPKTKG